MGQKWTTKEKRKNVKARKPDSVRLHAKRETVFTALWVHVLCSI